jgi:hypothetical protein
VLEVRGTAVAALGSASGEQGVMIGVPLSVSGGSQLGARQGEGTFESGLEYTSVGQRFGFRSSVRGGVQLGHTSGGYVGLRGGPVLMLAPPRESRTSPALTLEALVGVGTGGDIEQSGLFGACLSFDFDDYPGPLNLPHGRPFRCEDGSSWRSQARLGRRRSPSLGRALRGAERERIGFSYLEDGLDEHASVPAFERLALELAAHAAPAVLVARARRAAAEERHHARVCFALAEAYLGRDVKVPGFEPTRVRRARTVSEIVRESLLDGCIGEAGAAEVVRTRALAATDSAECHALLGIARDERGHARLAADVVAWGCASPLSTLTALVRISRAKRSLANEA